MPTPITRYRVLLSAPSDAKPFCDAADEEIAQINRTHSETTGVELYPTDWRRDSRADSGDEPQALLNKQIVDDADIVLAIFYKRFGTPTNSYGSGTEEEISIALDRGKRVLVYFWRPPQEYVPQDNDQLGEIALFRARLGKSALYKSFHDEAELVKFISHDFTKLVFDLEGDMAPSAPSLSLVSLDRFGGLAGTGLALIHNLAKSTLNPRVFDNRIKTLFQEISGSPAGMPLPPAPAQSSVSTGAETQTDKIAWASSQALDEASLAAARKMADTLKPLQDQLAGYSMSDPARISETDQKVIRAQLGELGLEPHVAFFDVGSLCVSKLTAPLFYGSGPSLQGSDDEKKKYSDLEDLASLCRCRRDCMKFLDGFDGIDGISLGLRNAGGSPAHHVSIDLAFPRDAYVEYGLAPKPSDHLIDCGLEDESTLQAFIEILYVAAESGDCRPYGDSIVRSESGVRITPTISRVSPDPFYGPRPLDGNDYETLLDAVFADYRVIDDPVAGVIRIRLSFDRVQQNAVYAFPARLLVRNGMSEPVRYRLTADEIEKPIEGELVAEQPALPEEVPAKQPE